MSTQIAVDGEKVPPELLAQVHVKHPGAPDRFSRSTLLVGSRGVGKTLLLRHRRRTHHPEAAYVNMQAILGTLDAEGIGSRTDHVDARTARAVQSKTRALVAATALDDVKVRLGTALRTRSMKSLIRLGPPKPAFSKTVDSPAGVFSQFAAIDLDSWNEDNSSNFQIFLSDLYEALAHDFSLFLDRVDDAPRAAVQALLPLLSQTVPFIVVLAVRVGATQIIPASVDRSLSPGDHFDVLHLGCSVQTESWAAFMREGINRFLASNAMDLLPENQGGWALRLARESLRNAIGHVQTQITYRDAPDRVAVVADHRRFVLRTARQAIAGWHDDFAQLITYLNKQAANEKLGPSDHLLVRILDEDGDSVVAVPERQGIHNFMLAALRTEAIFLPNGHRWHPNWLPDQFEVAPILAWDGRNEAWVT